MAEANGDVTSRRLQRECDVIFYKGVCKVNAVRIPFNKPYLTGRETDYIRQAVESGKISGNYSGRHDGRALPESDRYSDCLVRLPMYYELDAKGVIDVILER